MRGIGARDRGTGEVIDVSRCSVTRHLDRDVALGSRVRRSQQDEPPGDVHRLDDLRPDRGASSRHIEWTRQLKARIDRVAVLPPIRSRLETRAPSCRIRVVSAFNLPLSSGLAAGNSRTRVTAPERRPQTSGWGGPRYPEIRGDGQVRTVR
jgi:hypothetical protein